MVARGDGLGVLIYFRKLNNKRLKFELTGQKIWTRVGVG